MGTPATLSVVVTPAEVFGIEKDMVPDDAVAEAGANPPEATSICAGLDGHKLTNDGVTDTDVGVLATVTDVVVVFVQIPLL